MRIINSNINEIKRLCAKHKVIKLFVFGSVAKNSFNQNSDIDFVVTFGKMDLHNYADNYFDLKEELESVFNRPVDLLEEQAVKNPFIKKQIDSEKLLVYEQ